jgi:hypothetical protein
MYLAYSLYFPNAMSTPSQNIEDSYPVLKAFAERADLAKYERNGLMLFALELGAGGRPFAPR